jgi:hypothetical protein
MLYTFAGTSVLRGELKVRYANSQARAAQLSKLGDTDVNIVALPEAMNKISAARYLLNTGFASNDQIRAALEAEATDVPAKPKREVRVRVKVAKPSKGKSKVVKAKPVLTQPQEVVVTEEEVDQLYNAIYGNQQQQAS